MVTADRLTAAGASAKQPVAVVGAGCLQPAGLDVHIIDDAPGLIVTRTVAMLANLAADAVAQQVASGADIDTAMRLGTNYPLGPLAPADRWGGRPSLSPSSMPWPPITATAVTVPVRYCGALPYPGDHLHETATGARRVSERVRVRRDDAVWWVGLDRPDKRNALDQAMVDELGGVLAEARREPGILIVHSTTPGIFAAGADIAELRDRDADAALLAINAGLFEELEAHRWPTIALIDGPALGGGCELALACDFRIASTNAVFAQPELSLGILAGAGANWRLPQLVGLATARRMLYAGARLAADDALRAGLVDEIADDLAGRGAELAATIAARSWRALELTKLALRSTRPATTTFDLAAQALLFDSEDSYARMTAFLERRRP